VNKYALACMVSLVFAVTAQGAAAQYSDSGTPSGAKSRWYIGVGIGASVANIPDETIDGILYMENVMYSEKPPENGHRLNILGNFYSIGIDVYFDSVHHKMWYTQDFASP